MRAMVLAALLGSGCTLLFNGDDLRGTGADGGGGDDGGGDGGPFTLSFAPSMLLFNTTFDHVFDLHLGDLNGDGALDIAIVDDGAALRVLLNGVSMGKGTGSFTPVPNGYATCTEGTHLLLDDYLKNGKLDAVVTCRSTSQIDSAVTRLTNTGNDANHLPQFTRADVATGMPPTSFWAKRGFVVDVDKDGMLDVVIADYSPPAGVPDATKSYLTVYYGGTVAPVHYATPWADGHIDDMAVTDVNGDGAPDVVLSSSSDGQALIFVNKGSGARAALLVATPLAVANIDGTLLVADVNKDNKPDLLFTAFSANAFYWLLGNGDGSFKSLQQQTTDAGPESIAVGDLDGDGKLDVAVGTLNPANMNYEAHVDVFLGDGAGSFATKVDVTGALSFQGSSIDIGDLNGDGLGDIVLGSQNHSNLYILTNTSH